MRWSEILSPLSPSCTVTEPTWTNTNIQPMMKIILTILNSDQTNQLLLSVLSQFRLTPNMVARWAMLNQNFQNLNDKIDSVNDDNSCDAYDNYGHKYDDLALWPKLPKLECQDWFKTTLCSLFVWHHSIVGRLLKLIQDHLVLQLRVTLLDKELIKRKSEPGKIINEHLSSPSRSHSMYWCWCQQWYVIPMIKSS